MLRDYDNTPNCVNNSNDMQYIAFRVSPSRSVLPCSTSTPYFFAKSCVHESAGVNKRGHTRCPLDVHTTNTSRFIILIQQNTLLARPSIPRISRYASPHLPSLTSLSQRPARFTFLHCIASVPSIIRFVFYSSISRGSLTLLLHTRLLFLLLLFLSFIQ